MEMNEVVPRLKAQAAKVIVGQDAVFEQCVIALLAGGHVLLEGVPGTAKTLLARTLARLVQADFKRVQLTPDLMPSDIVGTQIFDLQRGVFNLHKGPVFTQLLLADEINRAPAKTQSALLEAMQERQVTIDGTSHPLDEPFMVLATQNPVEYEGTYPLPEAQLDRFMFKVLVDYPPEPAEREVLRRYHQGFDAQALEDAGLEPVLSPADIAALRTAARGVVVEEGILGYITAISTASRKSPDLLLGGSPRASITLLLAAKTQALLVGRGYVIPDDVKRLVAPTFRHRVILRPEAEIEGLNPDAVMGRLVAGIEVPR